MCLGIPGKVVAIYERDGMRMGKVDFSGGVIREACLAYVPELELGDYTIIHVGFALNKIDEDEAQQTLELLTALSMLAEERPAFNTNNNEVSAP